MNKKLIITLAVVVLILTAIIGVLLSRKDSSQKAIPPMPKLAKPDTSAPHFPE